MALSAPWNGREPISAAVYRNGLADLWQLALERGDDEAAELLLRSVGAEPAVAEHLIAHLFASTSIDGD